MLELQIESYSIVRCDLNQTMWQWTISSMESLYRGKSSVLNVIYGGGLRITGVMAICGLMNFTKYQDITSTRSLRHGQR